MNTFFRSFVVAAVALASSHSAFSLGDSRYVANSASPGSFVLAAAGETASLLVAGNDAPGVRHAAEDFAADLSRVTGLPKPALLSTPSAHAKELVIVGTLGHSTLIDDLVRRGKLDVSGIRGQWEAAVTTAVDHPLPGVQRALVIAGSDKRGTIFGVYTLSEQIGVSPWYW